MLADDTSGPVETAAGRTGCSEAQREDRAGNEPRRANLLFFTSPHRSHDTAAAPVCLSHGCYRRTGYRTSNRVARQFRVATRGTASKNPMQSIKHPNRTPLSKITIQSKSPCCFPCLSTRGLLVFLKNKKKILKSRKSPEKTFI